jgi:hypothetical protein
MGINIAIIPEIFRLKCGEAKRRIHFTSSKVLDNTKRHIPGPEIILPQIKCFVRLCVDVKDAETGEVFFSCATYKIDVAAMKHVKLGCLSGTPGQNYDCYITSETGRKTLMCERGASQFEGFRNRLRTIIPGFHLSPGL